MMLPLKVIYINTHTTGLQEEHGCLLLTDTWMKAITLNYDLFSSVVPLQGNFSSKFIQLIYNSLQNYSWFSSDHKCKVKDTVK